MTETMTLNEIIERANELGILPSDILEYAEHLYDDVYEVEYDEAM